MAKAFLDMHNFVHYPTLYLEDGSSVKLFGETFEMQMFSLANVIRQAGISTLQVAEAMMDWQEAINTLLTEKYDYHTPVVLEVYKENE